MSGCRRLDGCGSIRQRRGTAAGCPDSTVHRGHFRSLRVFAATGSDRLAGVRWWDAATATTPAAPAG
jgi:hypothetical protein